MRIRDWNTFIAENPSSVLLGAVVSTRLPAAFTFDKAGKKLPTPYKLFCEWLDSVLVGNWSAVAVPQGFVVGVAKEVDKATILSEYGPARHRGFRIGEKSVAVLSYSDGGYVKLATQRGYSLNI
ncbi:MAG: hypothetical protein RLY71_4556 [Pseudomonadota bacterium]|jgi:hypothetical protein